MKTVDEFLAGAGQWREELTRLCDILRSMDLDEGMKWGMPVYMVDGKNVVGIGAFKSYFGLWFYQGALLRDEKDLLINAQQGKTNAMRQWRMTAAKDIKPRVIKQYVTEAAALVHAGREIGPDRIKRLIVPPELKKGLAANKEAAAGFKALTPGLKREYADYIAAAKRDDTKQRRIDKILPMMAAGVGLIDKYR